MLAPAFVDPFTGYRLYSLEQLDVAVTIHLLRELDMPLAEIDDLVRSGDTDRMREILRGHRRQVAARLAETQRILTRLDDALHEVRGLMPYEVELVDLEPLWVVSCRARTTRPQIDAAYERCVTAIDDAARAREGIAAAGREVVLYHNVLQWYEGLDMEVCMPVEPRDRRAVRRLAARGRHRGAHRLPRTLGGRHLAGLRRAAVVDRAPWLRAVRTGARVLRGRRARHRRLRAATSRNSPGRCANMPRPDLAVSRRC